MHNTYDSPTNILDHETITVLTGTGQSGINRLHSESDELHLEGIPQGGVNSIKRLQLAFSKGSIASAMSTQLVSSSRSGDGLFELGDVSGDCPPRFLCPLLLLDLRLPSLAED